MGKQGTPMATDAQRLDGHEHTPDPRTIMSPHSLRCARCDEEIIYVNGFWRKAPERKDAYNSVFRGGPRSGMLMAIGPGTKAVRVHGQATEEGWYRPTQEHQGNHRVWEWTPDLALQEAR